MRARAVPIRPPLGILLALAVLLAGCVSPAALTADDARERGAAEERPVVVAVIDSGINPYHEAFAATPLADAAALAERVGARPFSLSRSDSFEESLALDQELLSSIRLEDLVHFEGTRVLAVSFFDDGKGPTTMDAIGHGTGTASLVARDAPHAILVSVKISGDVCLPPDRCFASPTIAAALEWAAAQPWIDVISVSIALPGNLADPPEAHPEAGAYLQATRKAAESGKLVVTAAGNLGGSTIPSYLCGPPWIVCVSAAMRDGAGDVAQTGRGVDVVANWSERLAHHDRINGHRDGRGTSYATPIVAAVGAEAIWHLRDSARGVGEAADKAEIAARARTVLNLSATTASVTAWRPEEPYNPLAMASEVHAPVLLPGQIGWGYVHAGLLPQVIANLGASPETDTPRAMAQAKYQQAREEYWARA